MTQTGALAGVRIVPLKRLDDARGSVMHMLRADAAHFEGFGEVYFSTILPGAVKAWRRHTRSTSNLAVPMGQLRLVLFDARESSSTRGQVQQIVTGEQSYSLITVPPGIWTGWQGLGDSRTLLANCATLPHDPAESERLDESDPSIPFVWH